MTAKEGLLIIVITLVTSCWGLNPSRSSEFGEVNLSGHLGMLTSPNQYSQKINCSWSLPIWPNTTTVIVLTHLDVPEDSICESTGDCCKNNALVIANERLCGKESRPRLIALGALTAAATIRLSFITTTTNALRSKRGYFRIIFSIRNKKLCEGYDLSCLDKRACFNTSHICDSQHQCPDHSDEIGCTRCLNHEAPCGGRSNHCFDPRTQRCDGFPDCPQGEDELNCQEICLGKSQCADKSGCYSDNQICDHKSDCLDNSDEVNCTRRLCGVPPEGQDYFLCRNRKCIQARLMGNGVNDCGDFSDEYRKIGSNLVALVIFSATSLTAGFFALIYRWCLTRIDVSRLLRDLPQFPLPPFRGPGEIGHFGYNVQFSESDYVRGGEIYEAFAQIRTGRRLGIDRGRQVTCLTMPDGQQRLFVKYSASCAAAALASLGISSESFLDSDKGEFFEKCGKSCEFCHQRSSDSRISTGVSDLTSVTPELRVMDDKPGGGFQLYLPASTLSEDWRLSNQSKVYSRKGEFKYEVEDCGKK